MQRGAPEHSGQWAGAPADRWEGALVTPSQGGHIGRSMNKLSSDGLYFLRKQEARMAAQSGKERC